MTCIARWAVIASASTLAQHSCGQEIDRWLNPRLKPTKLLSDIDAPASENPRSFSLYLPGLSFPLISSLTLAVVEGHCEDHGGGHTGCGGDFSPNQKRCTSQSSSSSSCQQAAGKGHQLLTAKLLFCTAQSALQLRIEAEAASCGGGNTGTWWSGGGHTVVVTSHVRKLGKMVGGKGCAVAMLPSLRPARRSQRQLSSPRILRRCTAARRRTARRWCRCAKWSRCPCRCLQAWRSRSCFARKCRTSCDPTS